MWVTRLDREKMGGEARAEGGRGRGVVKEEEGESTSWTAS